MEIARFIPRFKNERIFEPNIRKITDEEANKILSTNQQNVEVLIDYILFNFIQNKIKKVTPILFFLQRKYHSNPKLLNLMGIFFFLMRDFDKSSKEFEKALKQDRNYINPYLNLALQNYYLTNDPYSTIKYLLDLQKFFPENIAILKVLGRMYLEMPFSKENLLKAYNCFKKIKEMEPACIGITEYIRFIEKYLTEPKGEGNKLISEYYKIWVLYLQGKAKAEDILKISKKINDNQTLLDINILKHFYPELSYTQGV